MNHLKKIIIAIIVAVIIIVGGIFGYYKSVESSPLKTNEDITVKIEQGQGFYSVINQLEAKGVLKSELFTKLYLKFNSVKPDIVPGEYIIEKNQSLPQIIDMLETQNIVKIVIPEGYNIEQIGEVFQKEGMFTKEDFINAVKAYPLPKYIKKVDGRRYQLEGYLFPDTYDFVKGMAPDQVIKTMLDEFQVKFKEAEKIAGVTVPEDKIDNIIVRASVIEREANTFKDMQNVSSVIDNRIAKHMKLQMDATALYALNITKADKVYYKQIDVKSPYNTYYVYGLPIGPICNPGIKAIEAALKPAQTNYIYYILQGNEHFFTDNYQEFLKVKKEVNS